MDKKALASEVRKAKLKCLKLSREVPTRQCSPYGGLITDTDDIMATARSTFETLMKVEQALRVLD